MSVSELIFSEKWKYKIARHLAFWGMYYVYTIITNLPDVKIQTLTNPALYKYAWYDAVRFLPLYLFSVYFSLYFILPKFLAKGKISFLILSSLFLIIITLPSGYFIAKSIFKTSNSQWDEFGIITLTIHKCIGLHVTITGAAILFKILKGFSLQQQENEVLAIENTRIKIQLLKTQMHPRILFESFHNIYKDIDAGTVHAPEMIIKLSDLLSYLLYEGELKQVPLDMEVKMIQNYIELKKLEYKDQLDISIEMNSTISTYYIPPGLFLPLLETGIVAFEKLEKPLSVSIELKTNASKIYFTLKNNIGSTQLMKMPAAQSTLDSIKKRFQISHLSNFKMEVNSTSDSFSIMLQFELDKIINLQNKNTKINKSLNYEHT